MLINSGESFERCQCVFDRDTRLAASRFPQETRRSTARIRLGDRCLASHAMIFETTLASLSFPRSRRVASPRLGNRRDP